MPLRRPPPHRPTYHRVIDLQQMAETCEIVRAAFEQSAGKRKPGCERIHTLCTDPAALLEHARAAACAGLQQLGKLPPLFVFFSRSGMVVPVQLSEMPTNENVRRAIGAPLAKLLHLTSAIDAYMLIYEIWMAVDTAPWVPGITVPPSERPDRREGVIIRVANRAQSRLQVFETVRGEAGSVVDVRRGFGAIDGAQFQTQNSLLSNLFETAESTGNFAMMIPAPGTPTRH